MEIFWTEFAANQINEIYDYYLSVAGDNVAKVIINEIFSKVERLLKFPNSGQIEPFLSELKCEHKYILISNYKVIFRIINDIIYITDVFDTRQSPDKLSRNMHR